MENALKHNKAQPAPAASTRSASTLWKRVLAGRIYYLLLLPAILYYIIFAYIPMYGVVLAFKSFKFNMGIVGSPWVGFDNFRTLMTYSDFWVAFRNTIIISFGRLVFQFPVAIILALLLNEVLKSTMKRIFQTVFTFPHFISWVVLSGVLINLLGDSGIVNQMLVELGLPKIALLIDASAFRWLLFITDNWKEAGWGAIIYLAAISGINPEMYEAAYVDGANRWQQLRSITLPSIYSTISIMLILAVGGTMNGGFDQIFNLYSASVYNVAEIIDTLVYRLGFQVGTNYGLVTAIGLFKSVVGLIMLAGANYAVKKMGQEGLI
jgi:putative aldouronate transport system permease protein